MSARLWLSCLTATRTTRRRWRTAPTTDCPPRCTRPTATTPGVSPAAWTAARSRSTARSEEHTSELQSQSNLVCRLLLEKKKSDYRLADRIGRNAAGCGAFAAHYLRVELRRRASIRVDGDAATCLNFHT